MDYVLLLVGLVVLVLSGNYLVDSSTGIARFFRLPTLIIGLTVVAFGTSAPELFVSLLAGFRGSSSMALGNVVGSNCINVSVICGVTALICPFAVSRQSISTDTVFLLCLTLVMLGIGAIFGGIARWAGLAMFGMLLAFTIKCIKQAKSLPQAEANADDIPDKNWPMWVNLLLLVLSIGGLSLGANLMLASAEKIAASWGIPQRVIAVTVVALGTSLPELTASVLSALKGQSDMAVGNIVGSNIFNIGCVLGLSSAVSPIAFGDAAGVTTGQFAYDALWVLGFELMLLIGMINVTDNYAKFRKNGNWTDLISPENGLVGRIWGGCALALYAIYVCSILGVINFN